MREFIIEGSVIAGGFIAYMATIAAAYLVTH